MGNKTKIFLLLNWYQGDTAKVDQVKDLEYPQIAFAENAQSDRESGKGETLANSKSIEQDK